MGYPETAEGFMVNDQKNWTKFEKKEVRGCSLFAVFKLGLHTDTHYHRSVGDDENNQKEP
jgi:hypothetical protein